jgi:hypothetical protein
VQYKLRSLAEVRFCTSAFVSVYMCACHVCMYVYMCVYMYICTCVCVRARVTHVLGVVGNKTKFDKPQYSMYTAGNKCVFRYP